MSIPEPTNGEPMTLDELARIINTGFEGVQKNFVQVRSDIHAVREELKNEITHLRVDMVTKDDLIHEVKKLNFAVEIDALENRVKRVEQKLGLAQS
jgi:hypothetical protein